jgi:hypothetical protein
MIVRTSGNPYPSSLIVNLIVNKVPFTALSQFAVTLIFVHIRATMDSLITGPVACFAIVGVKGKDCYLISFFTPNELAKHI